MLLGPQGQGDELVGDGRETRDGERSVDELLRRDFVSPPSKMDTAESLKSGKPQIAWGFPGVVLHGNKERFA